MQHSKREILENKQKRWMADREKTLEKVPYTETSLPLHVTPESRQVNNDQKTDSLPGSSKESVGIHSDDHFINKLTEKLTSHIRDEIKKEMNGSLYNSDIRDVVADKMESYLHAELHTHTCKLCNELMNGDRNMPMILFPCGHSFCKMCLNTDACKRSRCCPYCR